MHQLQKDELKKRVGNRNHEICEFIDTFPETPGWKYRGNTKGPKGLTLIFQTITRGDSNEGKIALLNYLKKHSDLFQNIDCRSTDDHFIYNILYQKEENHTFWPESIFVRLTHQAFQDPEDGAE